MGKISKIFYKELSDDQCTVKDAAEFYYHLNLIGSHEMFHKDYEDHEISQINLKNKVIGDAIKNKIIDGYLKINSSVIAISSMNNHVVIIANIN